MKKWILLTAIIFCLFAFTTIINNTNDPSEIKTAINKSLPLLESSSHEFLTNAATCHSCHSQSLPDITFSLARTKGFAVNKTTVDEALDSIINNWSSVKAGLAESDDPALPINISGGYDLWALSANHYKTNKTITLIIENIMHRQTGNGSWVSPNPRPPLEYYSFTATALAIKGMQAYAPVVLKDEVSQRINIARNWLIHTTAETNEEKAYQLLGLSWSNADSNFIKEDAKNLLAKQHKDGGWSQLDSLPTDAYATGQSLYALNQSGQLDINASPYQKGITFLLKTQFTDGSWEARTRSYPIIPYVTSGFPHDDNQFISSAASSWATIALLLAAK